MDALQLHIQHSSDEPISRQIANQLRRFVAGGQLPAGTRLPSVRDVAGTHVINPMTVSRAYAQLKSEGVLEHQRGKAMTVAARPSGPESTAHRLRLLDPTIAQVAQQARDLELPPKPVLARLLKTMA